MEEPIPDMYQTVVALGLSSARLLAVFTVMPVLSDQMVPGMARRTVVVALALLVLPTVSASLPDLRTLGFAAATLILVKEALLGAFIGFLGGMPFWIAENVGNFIDNQRGATMGQVFAPLTGAQDSPIGLLLLQAAAALFFATGSILIFLGALYESYRVWPVFSPMPEFAPNLPGSVLALADGMLRTTVVLAAPPVIVMLLATIGLGIINRSVPQLNVFFLAMPVKSALGILFLMLYLGYLFEVFDGEMRFNVVGYLESVFL